MLRKNTRIYPTNTIFMLYCSIQTEEGSMAGRFEGVSDSEWRLFEDILALSQTCI